MPLMVLDTPLLLLACEGHDFAAKLFQIGFLNDGSLFVAFPYINGMGSVGEVSVEGNPSDITVGDELSSTAHGVKYCHHPSGIAHFSLTGKVRTDVRRRAVRLDRAGGHVFTVTSGGMRYFAPLRQKDRGKAGRVVAPYRTEDAGPIELKVVGFVYTLREAAGRMIRSDGKDPWFATIDASGKRTVGLCLSIPCYVGQERHVLILSIEERRRLDGRESGQLIFFGGFDPPEVAGDHSAPLNFLFAGYNTESRFDPKTVQRTIDLQ